MVGPRRVMASVAAFALFVVAVATMPTGCSDATSGGSEAGACSSGQTPCGSKCTNVKEDPENCGACGMACPAFSICDLGTCTGAAEGGGANDAAADAALDAASDAPADGDTEAGADAGVDATADAADDADAADAAGE